ncbi:MAG: hypothetical protein R3301_01370 [Saprospiraceae bacterium]|nr:hypothetical protein [Saprospiraceae bacterium]
MHRLLIASMMLWMIALAACSGDGTTTITIDPVSDQQDFRIEAPAGTVRASLEVQGESSHPFSLFVSDGLFTSQFNFAAGPIEDVKSFDWYDSPLLLNYVPDTAVTVTGQLTIACSFQTGN